MTTTWAREHLAALGDTSSRQTGRITEEEATRALPHLYLWDPWPVRRPGGGQAIVDGDEIWMALSAPSDLEAGQRHDVARLRLIARHNGLWSDLGPVFPDGASAGSREWAGCATYFEERSELEVYYTASGRRGESRPSFVQRIMRTTAGFPTQGGPGAGHWTPHVEAIAPGGYYQSTASQVSGEPGFIKAFRDPSRFTDPADGSTYVLFTGSLAGSNTEFDGTIGIATGEDPDNLSPLPPLVEADGVNNELERPHIVVVDDMYYLFFSTQARTFHPEAPGPTGLYGFVATGVDGPWTPLNGSGLVLRNPIDEPFQAYSWMVLDDLSVISFVDFHNLRGRRPEEVEEAGRGREHFGGTFAPTERIAIDGAGTTLLPRG